MTTTTSLERAVTDATAAATREQVETFLFEEADIADSHRYEDWLALWADDAFYWIPANDEYGAADPDLHVAIIHENYTKLEDRIRRLGSGYAHVQSPRSRISRVIGNIRMRAREDGLTEVHSTFSLTEFRRQKFAFYAGRQVHWLRPHEKSFLIVRKEVHLINNDGFMGNMTFLL
jgi:3-phenylpropionate/cinnamic acid dioxygenase small subunit